MEQWLNYAVLGRDGINVSFCKVSIKLQRTIAHIVVEVYGFKSFAKPLQFGYVFFQNGEFWEPQKEILNEKFRPLWTETGFFFLAKVSKYKASHWRIFSQSNFTSLSTILFQGIVNSASFDLSISALVLILDISRSHESQVITQVVVNWPYVTWDQAQF